MAEPMSDRLVKDAPFWRESQYEAAGRLEDDLRAIANGAPSWLYDDSGLGALIDKLNEARHHYEMEHREPVTIAAPRVMPPGYDPLTGKWNGRQVQDPISGRWHDPER